MTTLAMSWVFCDFPFFISPERANKEDNSKSERFTRPHRAARWIYLVDKLSKFPL